MTAVAPKRQPEKLSPSHHAGEIYTSETTGLLVIAVLILILTLVRYWHFMSWSWR